MEGDLVILGDVDEIPRPEALRALRSCPFRGRHNCANLDGSFFYYSYSGYAGDWKAGPKASAPCILHVAYSFHQYPTAACGISSLHDAAFGHTEGPPNASVALGQSCPYVHGNGVRLHACLQVVVYEEDGLMDGADQDSLRFEGNCTLQLPKSSTHCTDCFSTIAAFQNKVWHLQRSLRT